MKKRLFSLLSSALILFGCAACESGAGMRPYEKPYPSAPAVYESEDAQSMYFDLKNVMIEGERYGGKETRFFAYIGIPEGASRKRPVPGIVLLHGGGGTAYAEWVRLWNAREYAAIAVDLEGHLPGLTEGGTYRTHEYSGPARDGVFADIVYRSEEDTFWYHAVHIASRAFETLANFEEVDEHAVGLMGISWGGIIGSMTLGRDPRFAFGILVYGCGYLFESENFYQQAIDSFPAAVRERYIGEIDGAATFAGADMPILWLNSDEDLHFSPMITTKSHLATQNSVICLKPEFSHSHQSAWAAKEPYAFADGVVKGGAPLLKIAAENEECTRFFIENFGREVKKVKLYYSAADALETWQAESARAAGGAHAAQNLFRAKELAAAADGSYSFELDSEIKTYYIYMEDSEGNASGSRLYCRET